MAMTPPVPPRPFGLERASATPSAVSAPGLLQRRSTLKRSIDETTILNTPSSPSKRSRVSFDPDIEIVSADDDDEFDPLIVKEQVRRAIERRRNGNSDSYEEIRAIFTTPPDERRAPSTRSLRVHLQALLSNVANLSKDCTSLINAVLFSEWLGRDDVYFALFVKFITNLAAAQRGFQTKITEMLVDSLGPQKTRRLPDCQPVRAPKIHRRALQAIQYLTASVPSASASLADRLSAKLEFEFDSPEERMPFIRNYMQLLHFVPELANEIIVCILRQLIKLDVNIQENLDDVEDEIEEELLQHMSDSQTLLASSSELGLTSGMPSPPSEDSDIDSVDSSLEAEERAALLAAETPEDSSHRRLKDNIKQVDIIMDLLFSYYTSLTTSPDLLVRANAIAQLLSHFTTYILPAYRSRHPQFLIFHFAQCDPEVVEAFIAECISILTDGRHSPHIRQAAAAYFSGFVGRGAQVSQLVVSDCLDVLTSYLEDLQLRYEPSCRGVSNPDLKRYGDFYSVFQAILYIFCFRWRDIGTELSDSEDDESDFEKNSILPSHKSSAAIPRYEFEPSLQDTLHKAIYSPLNPLRVCTPVIVDQFAKISHALQFMYIFPKIDENKRLRAMSGLKTNNSNSTSSLFSLNTTDTARDMSWVGSNGVMEGYFPYDPYSLPISRRWIEGDYVEWKGIPGEIADTELSDEDDNDNNDDEED